MTISDEEIQRLRKIAAQQPDEPWQFDELLEMGQAIEPLLDELERLRKENAEITQSWMNDRAILQRISDANLAKLAKAREGLELLNRMLTIPAAECVPAIGDYFLVIDRILKELSE